MSFVLAVCAEMVHRDLPVVERARLLHEQRLRRRDLGLDRQGPRRARGDRRPLHLDDRLRRRLADRPRGRRRPAGLGRAVGRGLARARHPEPQPARHRARRARAAGPPGGDRHRRDVAGRGRDPGPGRRPRQSARAWCSRLENLNTAVDHPGTPFARAADTAALVAAVDSPHLRMNLDLYHAQIGEGNLIELVREHHPPRRRGPGGRRARALRAGHRRDPLPRGGRGPRRDRLRRRGRDGGLGVRRLRTQRSRRSARRSPSAEAPSSGTRGRAPRSGARTDDDAGARRGYGVRGHGASGARPSGPCRPRR